MTVPVEERGCVPKSVPETVGVALTLRLALVWILVPTVIVAPRTAPPPEPSGVEPVEPVVPPMSTPPDEEEEEVKVAVTEVLAVTVRVQMDWVPEQLPDQLEKVEPLAGVAVRVVTVPEERPETEQLEPQLMEPPEEVTVPEPVPALETERVKVPELVGQLRTMPHWVVGL